MTEIQTKVLADIEKKQEEEKLRRMQQTEAEKQPVRNPLIRDNKGLFVIVQINIIFIQVLGIAPF